MTTINFSQLSAGTSNEFVQYDHSHIGVRGSRACMKRTITSKITEDILRSYSMIGCKIQDVTSPHSCLLSNRRGKLLYCFCYYYFGHNFFSLQSNLTRPSSQLAIGRERERVRAEVALNAYFLFLCLPD